jgi:hypothetical protein
VLERLMITEPDLVNVCFGTLREHYLDRGNQVARQALDNRRDTLERILEQDARERGEFNVNATLRPHALPAEILTAVQRFLATQPVASVWIVCQETQYRKEIPHYIVAVKLKTLTTFSGDKSTKAVGEIAQGLPFEKGSWVVILHKVAGGDRLRAVPGAQVL